MKPSKTTTWPVARRPVWPSGVSISTVVRSRRALSICEATMRFQISS